MYNTDLESVDDNSLNDDKIAKSNIIRIDEYELEQKRYLEPKTKQ